MTPAWVAPTPEKKPFTPRAQSEQAVLVLVAAPEPVKVLPLMELMGALTEPEYLSPPAVAERLTLTVLLAKLPVKDAEFRTPGAAEPFAKVGLVAPIRLYVKAPLFGMLAAGVGIPVT